MKTTGYGTNSLCFRGPKVWNVFPAEIKSAQNVQHFESLKNNCFHNYATVPFQQIIANANSEVALCLWGS